MPGFHVGWKAARRTGTACWLWLRTRAVVPSPVWRGADDRGGGRLPAERRPLQCFHRCLRSGAIMIGVHLCIIMSSHCFMSVPSLPFAPSFGLRVWAGNCHRPVQDLRAQSRFNRFRKRQDIRSDARLHTPLCMLLCTQAPRPPGASRNVTCLF